MHLSPKSFDRLLEQAIAALPPEYAQWIDEVPIIVEDRPSKADLAGIDDADADEGEPLGMFIGPTLADSTAESRAPPNMMYSNPRMAGCTTQSQLAEEIRKTLLHELGHHAGMDESDLDRLGYGPLSEDIEFDLDP